jgi:hypothetical protein
MARALPSGGRLGFSDLVRTRALPAELQSLLAWISCVADARPLADYRGYLDEAGFSIEHVEDQGAALSDLVRALRTRLLAATALARLGKVDLPDTDMAGASAMARKAAEAVRDGTLGYVLLTATRR